MSIRSKAKLTTSIATSQHRISPRRLHVQNKIQIRGLRKRSANTTVRFDLPHPIQTILGQLIEDGIDVWIVGGAVRDLVLGLEPRDFDLVCNAGLKDQVIPSLRRTKETVTGIDKDDLKRGSISAKVKDLGVVNITRLFKQTGNMSEPTLEPTDSIDDDVRRRDFSINAMYWSPKNSMLIDPLGGRADLVEHKTVRAIGVPNETIPADIRKALRAIRFSVALGLGLDPALDASIKANRELTYKVSKTGRRRELDGILSHEKPSAVFRKLDDYGLLEKFLPPIHGCKGHDYPPTLGGGNRYEVMLRLVDASTSNDPMIRLTIFLYALGVAQSWGSEIPAHYPSQYGPVDIMGVLKHFLDTFRIKDKEKDGIAFALRHSRLDYKRVWDLGEIVHVLNLGISSWHDKDALGFFETIFHLAKTQNAAGLPVDFDPEIAQTVYKTVRRTRTHLPFLPKELAVNGGDIIRGAGVKGPKVGQVQRYLLQRVQSGEIENTVEALTPELGNIPPEILS